MPAVKVQALSSTGASLPISAAGAGNFIVVAINNLSNGSVTTPPTLTGFTVLSGSANTVLYNTSGTTGWLAYKLAVGGETTLSPTAGAGTISGMTAIEISGLGTTPTVVTPVLNNALIGTGNSSGSLTTTNTGSVILFESFGTLSTGAITFDVALTAYTNTGLIAQGAYSIPGTTVTSKTYVNTDATSRPHGNMVIEIQPGGVFNPTVVDSAATSVTSTTATLNANITSAGGGTIGQEGFFYSTTTPNPVILTSGVGSASATPSGSAGTYSSNVTGLLSGTLYYVNAYCQNQAQTGFNYTYANDSRSFTTAPAGNTSTMFLAM